MDRWSLRTPKAYTNAIMRPIPSLATAARCALRCAHGHYCRSTAAIFSALPKGVKPAARCGWLYGMQTALQVLELERDTAIVEAAIRRPGRTEGRSVDVTIATRLGFVVGLVRTRNAAAADQEDAAAGAACRRIRDRIRTDVEQIVAADRELEGIGDVIAEFPVQQADTGLVEGNFLTAGVRADVAVLRPVIALAQREAELVQRPVGRQDDFLGRRRRGCSYTASGS